MLNNLELRGCRPEPLASYLKALGILRLVAEQKDAQARGFWRNSTFYLQSPLNRADLEQFFLEEYCPTPLVAPWNSGSGFFGPWVEEKSKGFFNKWDDPKSVNAVESIKKSQSRRLEAYRQAIITVEKIVSEVVGSFIPPQNKKEKKKDRRPKDYLDIIVFRDMRSRLPDDILPFLDATFVLTGENPKLAPLLGTGGNDGNMDFVQNFMQRLQDILPFQDNSLPAGVSTTPLSGKKGKRTVTGGYSLEKSKTWLLASISREIAQGLELVPGIGIGQFHPGGIGGPNATQGFEALSLVNPWDYVLVMEGMLFFAGSVARRLDSRSQAKAAFPFTVANSSAGWSTVANAEVGAASRSEIWLPVWEHPAGKAELSHVFAEGRAQVGRRQAQNGVDFSRAVASLGVDRGVQSFQRFGFLKRSGKAYLAIPLGRVSVTPQADVCLLEDLDPWLDGLRRACSQKETPERYRRSLRQIEDSIFAFCQHGRARHLQDIVAALGAAEQSLAVAGEKLRDKIRPLYHFSPRWLSACDDGSTEFRIAAALASIFDNEVGAIREQMEPVEKKKGRYQWATDGQAVTWGGRDLYRNLAALLERRCLEANRKSLSYLPLGAHLQVPLGDITQFLNNQIDETRLANLFWGLATLKWSSLKERPNWPLRESPALPRAYALLKLLFLPAPLKMGGMEAVAIRPEAAILSHLRRGYVDGAISIACRRLRASGLVPLAGDGKLGRHAPDFICPTFVRKRLAAALLIPIWQTGDLAELVLRPSHEEISTGQ